jgi:hypothetical protein
VGVVFNYLERKKIIIFHIIATMSTDKLLANRSFDQLIHEASNVIQNMKSFNDELQSNEPDDYNST